MITIYEQKGKSVTVLFRSYLLEIWLRVNATVVCSCHPPWTKYETVFKRGKYPRIEHKEQCGNPEQTQADDQSIRLYVDQAPVPHPDRMISPKELLIPHVLVSLHVICAVLELKMLSFSVKIFKRSWGRGMWLRGIGLNIEFELTNRSRRNRESLTLGGSFGCYCRKKVGSKHERGCVMNRGKLYNGQGEIE